MKFKFFRPKPSPAAAASTEGRVVYAIGDIHVYLDLLDALLDTIARDFAARHEGPGSGVYDRGRCQDNSNDGELDELFADIHRNIALNDDVTMQLETNYRLKKTGDLRMNTCGD